jgi:hypothetical protein
MLYNLWYFIELYSAITSYKNQIFLLEQKNILDMKKIKNKKLFGIRILIVVIIF